MSRFRIKPPKTYKAACELQAGLTSHALLLGPSAPRQYLTHLGPLDADYVDAAVAALCALVDDGALQDAEATQLRWGMGSALWTIGDFERAQQMVDAVLASPSLYAGLRASAERTRALLRAGHAANATTAESGDALPPPLAAEDRRPRVHVMTGDPGIHAQMLGSSWNAAFSKTTPLGLALEDGSELPSPHDGTPLPLQYLGSSRMPAADDADVGRANRFLLLSARAHAALRAHLPPDARIVPALLEARMELYAVDLPDSEGLSESTSYVTRTKAGRPRILRGMFRPDAFAGRSLLRPAGAHEIFVAPAIARELQRIVKQERLRGWVLSD